ncbi:MAG: IS110 family transposase [Nitrososphaeraceae archaeon]
MDVHKNYLQVAVLDEKGKVLDNSRVDNNLTKVNEFFDSLHHNSKIKVVMESSGMWYNIYECLSKRHLDVRLSNPVKTRAIASAKIKTDKLDAIKLADLLRGGYIAECYIPTRGTMELRDIVRHRAALVRMRTKLKNKIHSIMFMRGTSISYVGTHTFTKGYIEKLKELNDYRINGYLNIIESMNDEINTVSKKILLLAQEDEIAKLLMTVPGIGYYSALLIVSEVGDVSRFPDSYHLCSYAGLVPSTRSSGGLTYHGSITKTGSKYLRRIMLECVHAHIRNEKNSNVAQFYHRISRKKGNSKAAVAAASKLVKIVYWIMKERRVYNRSQ